MMTRQVVLLAGGAGTRLASSLGGVPKVLTPVRGKPLLHWLLSYFESQGVEHVQLCLGVGAEQVRKYLAASGEWKISVTARDESTPLGTGGCLLATRSDLENEFFVVFGDTFTPLDLSHLDTRWRQTSLPAAMVVLRNEDWLVDSNVAVEEGLVVDYRKGAPRGSFSWVDYGISMFRRDVLDGFPAHPCDLSEIIVDLILKHDLAALEVEDRFYEIGTPQALQEVRRLADAGQIPGMD